MQVRVAKDERLKLNVKKLGTLVYPNIDIYIFQYIYKIRLVINKIHTLDKKLL